MITAPIMAMGESRDVGLKIGASLTVLAFGAIAGPPISGAINAATGGYKAVGYYAGTRSLTKYCTFGTDSSWHQALWSFSPSL